MVVGERRVLRGSFKKGVLVISFSLAGTSDGARKKSSLSKQTGVSMPSSSLVSLDSIARDANQGWISHTFVMTVAANSARQVLTTVLARTSCTASTAPPARLGSNAATAPYSFQ